MQKIRRKINAPARRVSCLFLALLGVAGLLAACAVNPVTGKNELALTQVSPAEEITLGEQAFPQAVQKMGGAYPDADLSAYVDRVGHALARLSERPDLPWQFRVINDSSPNAFAMPGGFIGVTRGLLGHLQNEAQLAAVLGHEIGHVTARHSVQGMQRGSLLNLSLAVLSGVAGEASYGPLAQQAGQLAATLVDRSYSREQEREADLLGIDYMVRAGYDPQGAAQVQEFFYRQLEGGAEPDWVSGIFRTHPFSKERMLDNEQYIRSRYPQAHGAGFRLGREPFQAAVAALRLEEPAFELYEQARHLEAKGETSKAIATYFQAATAAPDEALILTGLGMAYLRSEDPAAARPHLARAVKLDGAYYLSHLGLGYVFLQQGDKQRAVTELEAGMQLLPTLQGGFLLAEAYEKAGERQKAIALYQDVAKADPQGKLGRAAAGRLQAISGG